MSERPVLLLIDHYKDPFAGTEGQIFNLVRGLKTEGVPVRMALFRPSAYIEKHGFPCDTEVIGIERIFSLFAVWKMLCLALRERRRGTRVVHVFFNDPAVLAPLFFWMMGMAVVVSRRDMGFWYTPMYLRCLRLVRYFVAAVVSNSQAVSGHVGLSEGYAPSRLRVIYNGYAEDDFVRKQGAAPVLEGGPWVGLVANIRPVKRIEDAVRAVALVNRDTPCHLAIVGDGDPGPLKTLAASLGIADKVLFMGPQSSPLSVVGQLDVALLCSESEGFSNAIVEYLYCGRPVICTDTGGNPEIVHDGENGFLYQVGDVEALADRMRRLLRDPALARRMGERGRAMVGDEYSIGHVVREHQALYAEIAP